MDGMNERLLRIAERVRKIRGDKTQQEFADEVGVSPMAVSMYERAQRVPSDEVKIRIAKLGNMTVQEIFFD